MGDVGFEVLGLLAYEDARVDVDVIRAGLGLVSGHLLDSPGILGLDGHLYGLAAGVDQFADDNDDKILLIYATSCLTSLTAPGASALYPSAPIWSAKAGVTGAPPMIVCVLMPASLTALTVLSMALISPSLRIVWVSVPASRPLP